MGYFFYRPRPYPSGSPPCFMQILSYLCPVKILLKKAALVNLILLYGFVISFYNGADFFQYSLINGQQTEHQTEIFQSFVSKDLLSHTSSTGNAVKLVSHATAYSLKNQFTGFVEYIGATNQVILARFQQYSFFSKNLLLKISQYDIIYPSHFFW
jgi:hypothetical protein